MSPCAYYKPVARPGVFPLFVFAVSAVLHVLFLVVVLAYAAATALSVRAVGQAEDAGRKLAIRTLALAAVLQAVELVVAWAWLGGESMRGAALPLGLFAVVLSGGFAAFATKYRAETAGVLVAPASLVAGVLSAASSHGTPVGSSGFVWALPLHVVTVSTASGVMGLAAALAFLYQTQDRRLKRKDLSIPPRALVPLDVLDRTVGRLSYAAFFAYTLAVVAGVFMLRQGHVPQRVVLWRGVTGMGTWLLYGGVVAHRVVFRAHGSRAMRSVVFGFLLSMVIFGAYATLAAGAVNR